MGTLLTTEITLGASEALRVLAQYDKLDSVSLLIDVANSVHVDLSIWHEGSGTTQMITLKPDGTWFMSAHLAIGELP